MIEKYRIPSETAEGRALPLVPHQEEAKPRLLAFSRVNPVGHVDLYVCDACGYAELWADDFRGLVHNPERGVRLIDTSEAGAGPFR